MWAPRWNKTLLLRQAGFISRGLFTLNHRVQRCLQTVPGNSRGLGWVLPQQPRSLLIQVARGSVAATRPSDTGIPELPEVAPPEEAAMRGMQTTSTSCPKGDLVYCNKQQAWNICSLALALSMAYFIRDKKKQCQQCKHRHPPVLPGSNTHSSGASWAEHSLHVVCLSPQINYFHLLKRQQTFSPWPNTLSNILTCYWDFYPEDWLGS